MEKKQIKWTILFKGFSIGMDYKKSCLAFLWILLTILGIKIVYDYSFTACPSFEELQKLWEQGEKTIFLFSGSLILLWSFLWWILLGGAIYRSASVELASTRRISIRNALHYSFKRYTTFFWALGIVILWILFFTGINVFLGWSGGLLEKNFSLGKIFLVVSLPFLLFISFFTLFMIFVLLFTPGIMFACIAMDDIDQYDAVSRSMMYFFHCFPVFFLYHILAFLVGFLVVGFVAGIGLIAWYFCFYTIKWGWGESFSLSNTLFYIYLIVLGSVVVSYYTSMKTILYTMLRNHLEGLDFTAYYNDEK